MQHLIKWYYSSLSSHSSCEYFSFKGAKNVRSLEVFYNFIYNFKSLYYRLYHFHIIIIKYIQRKIQLMDVFSCPAEAKQSFKLEFMLNMGIIKAILCLLTFLLKHRYSWSSSVLIVEHQPHFSVLPWVSQPFHPKRLTKTHGSACVHTVQSVRSAWIQLQLTRERGQKDSLCLNRREHTVCRLNQDKHNDCQSAIFTLPFHVILWLILNSPDHEPLIVNHNLSHAFAKPAAEIEPTKQTHTVTHLKKTHKLWLQKKKHLHTSTKRGSLLWEKELQYSLHQQWPR